MNITKQHISTIDLRQLRELRESDLISAARAGSPHAFAELQHQYSRRLYRTICSITKNHEDAEDALQDTFLRAFVAIRNFEGRSSIYSWMTRIAINSALMTLRKRRSHPEICLQLHAGPGEDQPTFELRDFSPDPEESLDQHQQCAQMLSAIHRLDPRLRTAVLGRIMYEGSIKEVACALNLTEAALKTRLHRARRKLARTRAFKDTGVGDYIVPDWESGRCVTNPPL